MSMEQRELFRQARVKRDEAMQQAVDHADRVEPTWSERALAAIHLYAHAHHHFSTEDVRLHAYNNGLSAAPDARAWGAVIRAAAYRKWIEKTVAQKNSLNPGAHYREIRVWKSLLL
jgi:hypothetical protein